DAHQGAWDAFPGCGASALLALHATCQTNGAADDERYYRFTPAAIPPCGYLALGHYHTYTPVSRAPQAAYSGAPEPLEAQDDEAVVLRVEMEDGECASAPLALGTRRHRQLTLEITGLSADDVYRRIQATLSAEDLVTVRLTGLLDPDDPVVGEAMEAELSREAFFLHIDDRQLLAPAEVGTAGGVMGSLLRITRDALAPVPADHPDRARLLRASRYAQLALEGKL
ncbi:MAG TPA: hypothetical protein PLZ36_05520, partial [Armatimonadota bacterium]|nr:hypothetical protein [Armatimonadota bacterium]